jgi:D-alanyl-D-alanine carboxypeptidase
LHWTPLELLGFAFLHPPNFPAGSASAYSNTGYILLGLVIETVTGEKLDQVLDERIFRPLRLRATSFPSDKSIQPPVAHGYYLRDGNLKDLTPVLATANGRRVAVVMVNYDSPGLEGRFAAAPAALCSG